MNGGCRLNNKSMRNIRKDPVYQGLLMDLAMLGVVSQKDCEMLLGCGVPQNINLPNGKRGLLTTMQMVKEPVQPEPVPETPVEPETPAEPETPVEPETSDEGNEGDFTGENE